MNLTGIDNALQLGRAGAIQLAEEHVVTSAQAVVIDQDGERGVINAHDPQTQTYHVEHDGRTFIVPTDLLIALGQSYYSLPASFKTLARHETVAGQEALVIPVVAESLALSKRTVDRGAVRVHMTVGEREVVSKTVDTHTENFEDTVRRTRVDVEQMGNGDPNIRFRSHFNLTYGRRGYEFSRYQPAYAYGAGLANEQRFHGRDWATIETDVRRDWESRNSRPWEEFKDAVRYGWENVKDAVRDA